MSSLLSGVETPQEPFRRGTSHNAQPSNSSGTLPPSLAAAAQTQSYKEGNIYYGSNENNKSFIADGSEAAKCFENNSSIQYNGSEKSTTLCKTRRDTLPTTVYPPAQSKYKYFPTDQARTTQEFYQPCRTRPMINESADWERDMLENQRLRLTLRTLGKAAENYATYALHVGMEKKSPPVATVITAMPTTTPPPSVHLVCAECQIPSSLSRNFHSSWTKKPTNKNQFIVDTGQSESENPAFVVAQHHGQCDTCCVNQFEDRPDIKICHRSSPVVCVSPRGTTARNTATSPIVIVRDSETASCTSAISRTKTGVNYLKRQNAQLRVSAF